jgi:hypothetical protein
MVVGFSLLTVLATLLSLSVNAFWNNAAVSVCGTFTRFIPGAADDAVCYIVSYYEVVAGLFTAATSWQTISGVYSLFIPGCPIALRTVTAGGTLLRSEGVTAGCVRSHEDLILETVGSDLSCLLNITDFLSGKTKTDGRSFKPCEGRDDRVLLSITYNGGIFTSVDYKLVRESN